MQILKVLFIILCNFFTIQKTKDDYFKECYKYAYFI